LEVDPWKVIMRWGWVGGIRWNVFLEPESPLHVVSQECAGAWPLVFVEHDSVVVAARKTTDVLSRVAGWVGLLEQITGWFRCTVLGESAASNAAVVAKLSSVADVANACGNSHGVGEGDDAVDVSFVLHEHLTASNGGDKVDGWVRGGEGVVLG